MGDYPHGDTTQFVKDRFGMFIHWGLYALPGRHEWIRNKEKISNEDYQKYFDHYNPEFFNPKEWARAAKEAGMKYFVFTTKHHEGFCMWDTKYTDYKITNTKFGRDALREIVDAFRAEGLRVGFYYSLLDWHHPDFVIDRYHPLRDGDRKELSKNCDMKRYAEYMRNQVTELLTNYGKIDILWFDFSYPWHPEDMSLEDQKYHCKGHEDWESEKMLALVRSLQPDIVLDNRLDLEGSGDINTPEQYTPEEPVKDENGNPVVWEGCQTFSGSWGYYRDEQTWKTPKQCIDMLINHVSRNGNLLMNVGPTGRGYLDDRALDRLKAYGDWMKFNSKAIYECGMAPERFPEPRDCRYTYNAERNTLYLHLINWPFINVCLKNLADKIEYAQFLHDSSEVLFRNEKNGNVTMMLPVVQPPILDPVVEIFLKKDALN